MPPSRSQPETPMPPDRMTGFNPGPWNPHPGPSEVNNLLNRILCRKHVAARKGKNGNVAQSMLTSEFIGWRKTGMLQQYHLTAFHVTTWLGHLSSEITVTSEHRVSCLACNVILTDAHMPCINHSSKHAKHLSYRRFKHAFLVRRSRSLARRSSRLRHLLRNLRYSENVH